MSGHAWVRRGIVAGALLATGAVAVVAIGAGDSPAGYRADGAPPGATPAAVATTSTSPGAEALPTASKIATADAAATSAPPTTQAMTPVRVTLPPAGMPMSEAIKMIQDQAAIALAANPAVEPHDALGGPPVFPAGFDFGAASPPATAPSACTRAKRIVCVDKTTYTATVYESGKPQWAFYVRPGDARGPRYLTGEGYGRITHKSRNHVSSIYGTPMPYAMFISWDASPATGEAFHLSYQFQSEGYYGASHGCMGVGSEAAMKRLWDSSPKGTRVFVYRT